MRQHLWSICLIRTFRHYLKVVIKNIWTYSKRSRNMGKYQCRFVYFNLCSADQIMERLLCIVWTRKKINKILSIVASYLQQLNVYIMRLLLRLRGKCEVLYVANMSSMCSTEEKTRIWWWRLFMQQDLTLIRHVLLINRIKVACSNSWCSRSGVCVCVCTFQD